MEIVEVYKRSEIDEQGNPYPILYMWLDDKENVSIDVSLFFVVNGKFLIHCCKKKMEKNMVIL